VSKLRGIIQHFVMHPRKLLVVDAGGAALSAFLLGVVLVRFEGFFGIPSPTLYLLAAVPCGFVVWDVVFASAHRNKALGLRGIALLNSAYCLLSLGLMVTHLEVVTIWGWAYVLGELGLVLGLAWLEWQVAAQLR